MKTCIFKGLRIKIENAAGSVRSGIDRVTGKPWETKMTHDYGEIMGTKGVDGDPVDVFLGPNKSAPFVHVVHQLNKTTGEWDEDKCFLGFDDAMDAKAAYYKNYDNPDLFYGSVETIPLETFKQNLKANRGETMIHASIEVGDQVYVNGLRGRGIITEKSGSDVIIRYRNGERFKRKEYNCTNLADRDPKMWKGDLKSAEEQVDMEGNPIRVPHGNKRITKVGTNFCVISDGVDKNFGCYPDRKQAEAVMQGRSFIEPDIPGNLFAARGTGMPQTGWQYGKRTMPVGYVPQRTLSGFPAGTGGGRGGLPKVPHTGTPKPSPKPHPSPHVAPKVAKPATAARPPATLPKPPAVIKAPKAPAPPKILESYGDLGEPMAGSMGHAHIEPEFWFHPPSLTKRGKADYVPTDDPGEKDNRFFDVTKRKQSHIDRMKRLKRGAPGGLPPFIPAHTTLLSPHMASFASTIAGARMKLKKKKGLIDIIPRHASLRVPHTVAYMPAVKANMDDKRMRVSFTKQGCI